LELYEDKLFVNDMFFLARNDYIFPLIAKAKIRYRQEDQDCTIYKEENVYKVEFTQKQRAIASGQICAIYLEDELIMS
jgi:tRNA-specific 2-thiouridylase